MAKEMLINVSAGEECRIALLENNKLEELYMERTSNTSHVGNIYKGKVTNVEPSIQAAFVDFGIGRNGFLHISDLLPQYFGKHAGNQPAEKVGQKLGRRDRPPIQQCLRKGDEIVVQIIKEGIGTKGPTLSTYLSIPGRVLVMMPGMAKMGVSKKIEDEQERSRLRKILDGLTPPKDCGFIIRTAGIGKSKLEIEKDLKYLARLWDQLKKSIDKDKPPVELYTEGDLITRTVRDVFTSDVDQIIVDDKETAKKIKDFIKLAMPRTKNKVELYEDVVPLFHKYELEDKIEGMYSKRVPLPSGGSLIIDQTEAVVAIDVNSGKFRDYSDAETTAFKTDLEAADEIPRQLRLRDMGGVIICDFIDLRFERHRRELEDRLFENLKKDRAKTRMLRMSQFGIVEMTRQRMRPSLRRAIYHDCHACAGQGMVKTPESMALEVMRKLRIGLNDGAVVRCVLNVHPEVAEHLQNSKRYEIAKLEQVTEKRVAIVADAELSTDEIKFELYDSRDGYIYIAELGMALPTHQQPRRDGPANDRPGRGRGNDRREPAKSKHDRRDNEGVEPDDLFVEEGAPEADVETKPAGRGKAATKATKVADTDEIEQIGNDDEAGAVDVDEGGDSGPGEAAGTFMEPGERERGNRDRDRRGGRRDNRGRPDRGNRPEQRPDNRGPKLRDVDNRDADNRNIDDRDAGNRDADNRDIDDRDVSDRDRGDRAGGQRTGGGRDDRPQDGDRNAGRRGPNDRGNRNRPPLACPAAERPVDESASDEEEIGEEAENEEGVEGTPFDGTSVDAGQGPAADTGDQAPREGGRRRRRRRGRRGRGRNGENGGENGPSQGDNAEAPTAGGPDDQQSAPTNRDQPRRAEPRREDARRDEPRGDNRRNEPRRDQPRRDDSRRDEPRRDEPRRDDSRRDEPRRDDRRPQPQGDRQPRQQPPGGRGGDPRRGPPNSTTGPNGRRGSVRADLSHLAREAARQDAGLAPSEPDADQPRSKQADPAEDDHATPGNDINFVPKVKPAPVARGGRRGRPVRSGRGQAVVKRQPPLEGLPNDEELDAEAAALEAQLAKAREAEAAGHLAAPRAIEVPDVTPTGSSDSHLVDDEPADGEDVSPPSSETDLDALPDYDED